MLFVINQSFSLLLNISKITFKNTETVAEIYWYNEPSGNVNEFRGWYELRGCLSNCRISLIIHECC